MGIAIQQDVRGLNVSMQEASRVHVLESPKNLVNNVLPVDALKDARSNDSV
jgi:hypothetical protein